MLHDWDIVLNSCCRSSLNLLQQSRKWISSSTSPDSHCSHNLWCGGISVTIGRLLIVLDARHVWHISFSVQDFFWVFLFYFLTFFKQFVHFYFPVYGDLESRGYRKIEMKLFWDERIAWWAIFFNSWDRERSVHQENTLIYCWNTFI